MSFIKWVGGKSKIINRILPKFKPTNNNITYVEPFLGSGAVLISFLETQPNLKSCVCSDINKQLIITFNVIKNKPNRLINTIKRLINEYNKSNDKEEYYYKIRDKYNTEKLTHSLTAALFIFLNKTCFRGLYRINKNGLFNVPYGNYKKPSFIDDDYIKHLSTLFNKYNVNFVCDSYINVLNSLNENDEYIIYLDPPYLNTFDSYTENKFNSEEFYNVIKSKININKQFIVSNSLDFLNKYNDLLPNNEMFDIQDKINSKSPFSKRTEIILWS